MQNANADKLMKLSGMMQQLCIFALAVLMIATLYAVGRLTIDADAFLSTIIGSRLPVMGIGASQVLGIVLVNAVSVVLLAAALHALWKMFSQFAQGNILSAVPTRLMRRAGQMFLAGALWSIIAHSLTVLLATAANPQGERSLSIAFGSQQLFALLLAGTLFAVGHVLSEAIRLDQENKGFV
ncbi:MAG: hypothetical protein AAFY99_00035 [Pseudomonadota bacterium]